MSRTPAVARRALLLLLALVAIPLGLIAPAMAAQDTPAEDTSTDNEVVALRQVDILPLAGFIDPPVANAIIELIEDANERGSELVVLQLNSVGAIKADVDRLIDVIRRSEVPIVTFIGPRGDEAAGGGAAALLLYAAHVSAVAEDATVGPVSPVDVGEGSDGYPAAQALNELAAERVDDLRVTHVPEGVDPALADAALLTGVDALVQTRVTALDLAEAGAVDLVVAGLGDLLTELDGRTVLTSAGDVTMRIRNDEIEVRLHSLGLVRRILHAATTPTLIYLLVAVGLVLLLFEWFQPGFGVAGFTGLVLVLVGGFGLTVLPVTWWALALAVLGLGLFAVDTAIAGFGLVTIAATALFTMGSLNLYQGEGLGLSGWLVGLTAFSAAFFFVVVMTIILRAQAGPEGVALDQLVGRPGIVRSVLNPEGHVFVDEALWRARWIGEAKRAKVGTPIQVTGVEGTMLLVEPFEAAN